MVVDVINIDKKLFNCIDVYVPILSKLSLVVLCTTLVKWTSLLFLWCWCIIHLMMGLTPSGPILVVENNHPVGEGIK